MEKHRNKYVNICKQISPMCENNPQEISIFNDDDCMAITYLLNPFVSRRDLTNEI